jgi:hypothetical protein
MPVPFLSLLQLNVCALLNEQYTDACMRPHLRRYNQTFPYLMYK